jgi:outer membrane protein OmpA-like peptidoglycan-associated protein
MRSTVAGILAGFLVAAPAAGAPGPTAQDYVKAIQSSDMTGDAAAAPRAGCESGEARDDSGACPAADDSGPTRGFTLFSGSMNAPQRPTAAAPLPPGPPDVAARLHCGLLCDLRVSFKSGSATLTAESRPRLTQFAIALRDPALSNKRFEIAGHTDASGSPAKNRALSQARAEAVKAFLVARGVEASRLEARGYGDDGLALPSQPLDPRNRRVEARLLN